MRLKTGAFIGTRGGKVGICPAALLPRQQITSSHRIASSANHDHTHARANAHTPAKAYRYRSGGISETEEVVSTAEPTRKRLQRRMHAAHLLHALAHLGVGVGSHIGERRLDRTGHVEQQRGSDGTLPRARASGARDGRSGSVPRGRR